VLPEIYASGLSGKVSKIFSLICVPCSFFIMGKNSQEFYILKTKEKITKMTLKALK
jgi:hypothetical protein